MAKQKRSLTMQLAIYSTIAIGIILVSSALLWNSDVSVILGASLIFWSIILFYITPTKQLPVTYINALLTPETQNTERILTELNLTEKGIYLPPRILENIESSLIFIPKTSQTPLPLIDKTVENLYGKQENGIFITPPGIALSRLLEHELNLSFTKIEPNNLIDVLHRLLVDNIGLVENLEVTMEKSRVTIQTTGCLLDPTCQNTTDRPRTHTQIGCLIPSAFACILAKVTGKPITVEDEEISEDNQTRTMHFNIKEASN